MQIGIESNLQDSQRHGWASQQLHLSDQHGQTTSLSFRVCIKRFCSWPAGRICGNDG